MTTNIKSHDATTHANQFANETKSFNGFCTVINSIDSRVDEQQSQPKFAKEIMVSMVVGPDFKIPIAYELLNGLEGIYRAA